VDTSYPLLGIVHGASTSQRQPESKLRVKLPHDHSGSRNIQASSQEVRRIFGGSGLADHCYHLFAPSWEFLAYLTYKVHKIIAFSSIIFQDTSQEAEIAPLHSSNQPQGMLLYRNPAFQVASDSRWRRVSRILHSARYQSPSSLFQHLFQQQKQMVTKYR
jgi:hypothetical protein